MFTKTLSSPVARVFDVLHRWESSAGMDPELIALPQPPLPATDEDNLRLRSEKVFINQTEEGGWYALSGSRYPLILSAPLAPIHRVDWWRIKESWDLLPESQKSRALVGTHSLPDGLGSDGRVQQPPSRLLIDAPRPGAEGLIDGNIAKPVPPHHPPEPEPSKIFETAKRVPGFVATRVFDLVSNPAAIVLFIVTLWMLYKDRLVRLSRGSRSKDSMLTPEIEVNRTVPSPAAPVEQAPAVVEPAGLKAEVAVPEVVPADVVPAGAPIAGAGPVEATLETKVDAQPPSQSPSPTVTFAEPVSNHEPVEGADAAASGEPVKKKKGHRGHRGGVKHRKGNKDKRDNSQSRDDDPPEETVDEVITKAKTLVKEPKLEPDIITMSGVADEVSGHVLKMGSLEVNEAEQLGTGSNGTVVFAGKWDGRDVAVKRMLVQFNEIASQETRLLRESDDHPNGKPFLPPNMNQC
jgi:serine/threonine-protein kinase/endoribonuclease IRE1